jgi:hypothetical protein
LGEEFKGGAFATGIDTVEANVFDTSIKERCEGRLLTGTLMFWATTVALWAPSSLTSLNWLKQQLMSGPALPHLQISLLKLSTSTEEILPMQ